MLKNTLHHYYPGSTTLTGSTGSIGSDGNGMSADDPVSIKRMHLLIGKSDQTII